MTDAESLVEPIVQEVLRRLHQMHEQAAARDGSAVPNGSDGARTRPPAATKVGAACRAALKVQPGRLDLQTCAHDARISRDKTLTRPPAAAEAAQVSRPVETTLQGRSAGRDGTAPESRLTGCERGVSILSSETLTIGDHVVTLATLDRRLDGVRQVVVPPDAIVTPAAKDVLSQQNITLIRASASAAGPPRGALSAAAVLTSRDARGLLNALGNLPVAIEPLSASTLGEAIDQLVNRIRTTEQPGLLLTEQTAAALCLANRHRSIRGALGTDVAAVRAAVQSIGANLLVVDPAKRSLLEIRAMVAEFARGAARSCPRQFQALLETTGQES